jgi:hypothetical protein
MNPVKRGRAFRKSLYGKNARFSAIQAAGPLPLHLHRIPAQAGGPVQRADARSQPAARSAPPRLFPRAQRGGSTPEGGWGRAARGLAERIPFDSPSTSRGLRPRSTSPLRCAPRGGRVRTKPLQPRIFSGRSGKKILSPAKALAGICAAQTGKLSLTRIPEGECAHRSGKEGGCALFNSAGAMRSERGAGLS